MVACADCIFMDEVLNMIFPLTMFWLA